MTSPPPQTRQINVTLGTAGHIDHGKTALVKLLTGCETDRLKEEKERGMSIELGFAPCTLGDLEVGIVDVPGHEHFIKTMVAGATGMDGVLLVIAADDGVMPQTREHLDIMTLLWIAHGIVVLTKIDRADAERTAQVRADIETLVRGTFLEGAPVLGINNLTGDGFWPLVEAIQKLVASITPRSAEGVFRMPLERGFSMKGHGTVVSGVPVTGSVHAGDEVVLLPHNESGRIHSIQVYGRDSDTAKSGQCAAINVRHWDYAEIHRGATVATPGYFTPQMWYLCALRLLAHEGLFLKNGAHVKFHAGTSEAPATVYLMTGDAARAGEECLVQVRCDEPVVAGPGDGFLLRAASPPLTIGGGRVVEALSGKLKRTRAEVVEYAKTLADAVRTDRTFVEFCIRHAERGAAEEPALAVRTKALPARLKAILGELSAEGFITEISRGLWMHRETAAELEARILETLAEFHRSKPESPGMTNAEMLDALRLDKAVCAAAVNSLRQKGSLVERNQRLALAGHTEQFTDAERKLLDAVEGLFLKRPLSPPGEDEIAAQLRADAKALERALRILVEHGKLVRIEEGLLFHRDAVERARTILIEFIRKEGELESVKFKYLLDTSRKFAIPLLDHFDRIGLTARRGYSRYLKNPGQEPAR